MSNVPEKSHFADAYSQKAPWDIAGPQASFVQAADRVRGTLLDCGCGTGENALFFASRGAEVTGIDFLEEPIRRAKQKAAERKLAVNFLVMDALALDAMPQQFDNLLDSGLFHCFNDSDRQQYVAGLTHVARSGATMLLMCFSDAEPAGPGPRRVSEAELRSAFAAGWTIESIALTRFGVIPEFAAMFSPGGPQAWFVVARRK